MVSYNAAISACAKSQELCGAFDVCAEMQRHVAPNKVSYITLNSVSEKFQDTRRAVDVCAVMLLHALQPCIVSCKALISASENGQDCVGQSTSARRCRAKLRSPIWSATTR